MGFSMDRRDSRSNTKHGEAAVDALNRQAGRPSDRETWADHHQLRGDQDRKRVALQQKRQEAYVRDDMLAPQTIQQQQAWAAQQQAYEQSLQEHYHLGQLVTLPNGQKVPLTMTMVQEHLLEQQLKHQHQQTPHPYYADQLQLEQQQRQQQHRLKQLQQQSAAPLEHDIERKRRIDGAHRQLQQQYAEQLYLQQQQQQQPQLAEQPTGRGKTMQQQQAMRTRYTPTQHETDNLSC
jgi:hypothetical protein